MANLKHLTKKAPSDSNDRDAYDHAFMGHPYENKALPVALYDPILAELTYKLGNIDMPVPEKEDEEENLFPGSPGFHEAAWTFCKEAADIYPKEEKRSEITFKWLQTIFGGKCVEQYRIEKPAKEGPKVTANKIRGSKAGAGPNAPTTGTQASDSSNGSTYAKPDGVVAVKLSTAPVHDAEEEVVAGALQTKAKDVFVLTSIMEVKKKYGDAVMQCIKVSGRHLEGLEVSSLH